MKNFVEEIPFLHSHARTAVDIVLKTAFSDLESTDNTVSDRVALMKLIMSAIGTKMALLGDVTILSKAAGYALDLKQKIEALKAKGASTFEILTDVEHAAGAKAKVTRTIRKTAKKKDEGPVF